MLNFSTGVSSTPVTPASTEQLFEVLSLVNELLPQLPSDVTIFMSSSSTSRSAFGLFGGFKHVTRIPISRKSFKEIKKELEVPGKYFGKIYEFSFFSFGGKFFI